MDMDFNGDLVGGYSLNYPRILEQNDLMAVTKLLVHRMMENPYIVVGEYIESISDADLADFMVTCLSRDDRVRRILPIGGPGPAITPRRQAELLAELLDRPVRLRQVPVAVLRGIVTSLSLLGRVSSSLARKAELARIGLYYATESMLVIDPQSGLNDALATPEWGSDTLKAHYQRLLANEVQADLREHSVF